MFIVDIIYVAPRFEPGDFSVNIWDLLLFMLTIRDRAFRARFNFSLLYNSNYFIKLEVLIFLLLWFDFM